MTVAHVEILVEEPSMEATLRVVVPKIIGGLSFEVYPYQCKQDLLKQLPARLRGYAAWMPPDWRIIVIVDRDDDSCTNLKRRLEEMAARAGLRTRTQHPRSRPQVVNRLAIEELEAWFFGDWEAVCTAYPRVDPNTPTKQAFRDPDAIAGGTWQALERTLQRSGYFKTGLRKIEAARTIARHMEPERNRSTSFRAFLGALRAML